jgi:hypothetical protein
LRIVPLRTNPRRRRTLRDSSLATNLFIVFNSPEEDLNDRKSLVDKPLGEPSGER